MIYRSLIKNSVIYGGSDGITKLFAIVYFPLIASELSLKSYGIVELILTVTSLLGLLINCGINGSVSRFYWDKDTKHHERAQIITSGFAVQLFFGLLMVAVGCLFLPSTLALTTDAGWPITLIALFSALIFTVLLQISHYTLDVTRLHQAPYRFFVSALLSRLCLMVLGLLCVVYLKLGVDGLIFSQAAALFIILPFQVWLISKDMSFSEFSWGWTKRLVKWGYPFIFAGLAYVLFGSMDRWMLASMHSEEEVGIYSIASRFASVVLFVSAAFGRAWSPSAVKIQTDFPSKYRTIFGDVLLLLLFLMLIVGGGISLFAGEIMSVVMPAEYRPSALPLAILCFGIVLQSTQQVTLTGISLENKTFLFARLAWVVTALNFVGNCLLIPSFGATGASIATLLSYLALTSLYLLFTQKLHPLNIPWLRISVLLFLGIIVGAVSLLYISHHLNLWMIFGKLSIALCCLYLGWKMIPGNLIKELLR